MHADEAVYGSGRLLHERVPYTVSHTYSSFLYCFGIRHSVVPVPLQHFGSVCTMSGLWARYNSMLDAQPLLTKALTSMTGFSLGDILAQCFIEEGDKGYDPMRTFRMGSFGFLLHGTTGHYFYGFLDSKLPGTAPMTVASKVAIDQTIWNPIFGCMFFGYLNLMEGKSLDDYTTKIKTDLKTAVMGSWAVWVPAHTINFAFVPPAQRLLYINTIQIGYNVFLSFLGNKSVEEEPKKEL